MKNFIGFTFSYESRERKIAFQLSWANVLGWGGLWPPLPSTDR
jgi:hypothetical protein